MDDRHNPEDPQSGAQDAGLTRRFDPVPPAPPPGYQPATGETQALPPTTPAYGAGPVQPYGGAGQPPQYSVPNHYTPSAQYPPAPVGQGWAAYNRAPVVSDPTIAVVIEIAAGLFGFLGVGHLLSGRIAIGIALMVGWWIGAGIGTFILLSIGLFTFGLGCCLIPIFWWGVPIASGIWLRTELLGRPGWRP